jgi:hypothetical protein
MSAPKKTTVKNVTEEMRAIDWSVIDKIRTGGGTRQGIGMRQSMADQMERRAYDQQIRARAHWRITILFNVHRIPVFRDRAFLPNYDFFACARARYCIYENFL